jgi:hydrogenase-4 component E
VTLETAVPTLALAMTVTSLVAAEVRSLRVAAWSYLVQALLLVSIFVSFAVGLPNPALWAWVFVALATKALLIPALLFAYLRRTGEDEVPPSIGFGPSVIIAGIIMVAFYKLTHHHVDLLAASPATAAEPFRTNLAVALTIFCLGMYTLISRRDAVKSVIAICLLENGVHLSLVSLAPGMPEMPLIGIATEVFITVWLMLYVIGGIRDQFETTDAARLTELHT